MISSCASSGPVGSLLVFSDDWGRHPSSCQHLVRNLLDRYPVLWVNTIGTRAPRLDLQTLKRVAEKLFQRGSVKPTLGKKQKLEVTQSNCSGQRMPPHLTVVNPKMWPWFGGSRDRQLNRWLLSMQLAPLIRQLPQPVVGITTLPITADLPDVLPVDRWVYYCVDDFSQWPGLDGDTLRRMDRTMIRRADSLVAVSETLQALIAEEGRSSSLLTHGVDLEFWRTRDMVQDESPGLSSRIVFWGVIDRRLDTPSLQQLSRDLTEGTIVLMGPQQNPDPAILSLPNVRTLPAQPFAALPAIAQAADVLIMPYADLPVTRAMQPLKLKEYLATGKPVVVNQLPSTETWRDCLDVAASPRQFSRLVLERITSGIMDSQVTGRARLREESWHSKAEELALVLNGQFINCGGSGK